VKRLGNLGEVHVAFGRFVDEFELVKIHDVFIVSASSGAKNTLWQVSLLCYD